MAQVLPNQAALGVLHGQAAAPAGSWRCLSVPRRIAYRSTGAPSLGASSSFSSASGVAPPRQPRRTTANSSESDTKNIHHGEEATSDESRNREVEGEGNKIDEGEEQGLRVGRSSNGLTDVATEDAWADLSSSYEQYELRQSSHRRKQGLGKQQEKREAGSEEEDEVDEVEEQGLNGGRISSILTDDAVEDAWADLSSSYEQYELRQLSHRRKQGLGKQEEKRKAGSEETYKDEDKDENEND